MSNGQRLTEPKTRKKQCRISNFEPGYLKAQIVSEMIFIIFGIIDILAGILLIAGDVPAPAIIVNLAAIILIAKGLISVIPNILK